MFLLRIGLVRRRLLVDREGSLYCFLHLERFLLASSNKFLWSEKAAHKMHLVLCPHLATFRLLMGQHTASCFSCNLIHPERPIVELSRTLAISASVELAGLLKL